ncbi:MAG TPA: hypothetical protein VKX49_08285 [Bryobacteraceae bacterium]|nr:hypothetical protein [Bryobacteraceae bacterium]
MNRFFGRELYIRLAEGEQVFVCTTKFGKLFSRTKRISLNETPMEVSDESTSVPSRKPRHIQSLSLLQSDADELDEE